jgi:hypothetical protein
MLSKRGFATMQRRWHVQAELRRRTTLGGDAKILRLKSGQPPKPFDNPTPKGIAPATTAKGEGQGNGERHGGARPHSVEHAVTDPCTEAATENQATPKVRPKVVFPDDRVAAVHGLREWNLKRQFFMPVLGLSI